MRYAMKIKGISFFSVLTFLHFDKNAKTCPLKFWLCIYYLYNEAKYVLMSHLNPCRHKISWDIFEISNIFLIKSEKYMLQSETLPETIESGPLSLQTYFRISL